ACESNSSFSSMRLEFRFACAARVKNLLAPVTAPSLSAEPLVVHRMRAEVADRVDLFLPDRKDEEEVLLGPEIDVPRKAAPGTRLLSFQPRCFDGGHADV